MYSDMSKRASVFSLPPRPSASALAVSVLPTPEGPRNMNAAWGLPLLRRPTLATLMPLETRWMTSSWP